MQKIFPLRGKHVFYQIFLTTSWRTRFFQKDGGLRPPSPLDSPLLFLIISNMVATPKTTGNLLTVTLRLDTFVRGEAGSDL